MKLSMADIFHVQMQVFYYQPTTAAMLAETGQEGTSVISPNSLFLFEAADQMDAKGRKNIRSVWLECIRDRKGLAEHAAMNPELVEAARNPVPSEYTIELPISSKFKRDKVFGERYWRTTNGPSFEEVVETLVPFEQTRAKILKMQKSLSVPLHHINFMSRRHGLAIRAIAN